MSFVVSLTGHALGLRPSTPESILAFTDGNICRCMGYKSLERATALCSSLLNGLICSDEQWVLVYPLRPADLPTVKRIAEALPTHAGRHVQLSAHHGLHYAAALADCPFMPGS